MMKHNGYVTNVWGIWAKYIQEFLCCFCNFSVSQLFQNEMLHTHTHAHHRWSKWAPTCHPAAVIFSAWLTPLHLNLHLLAPLALCCTSEQFNELLPVEPHRSPTRGRVGITLLHGQSGWRRVRRLAFAHSRSAAPAGRKGLSDLGSSQRASFI